MTSSRTEWGQLPAGVATNVVKRLLSSGIEREDALAPPDGGKRRRRAPSQACLPVVDGLSAWERACENVESRSSAPLPFARAADGLCRACWLEAPSAPARPNLTAAAAARLTSTTLASAVDTELNALHLGAPAEGRDPGAAGKFVGVRCVTLLGALPGGGGHAEHEGSLRSNLGRQMPSSASQAAELRDRQSAMAANDEQREAAIADHHAADGYCHCDGCGAPGRLALAGELPALTALDGRECAVVGQQQLRQLAALTGLQRLALGHACLGNPGAVQSPAVPPPSRNADAVHSAKAGDADHGHRQLRSSPPPPGGDAQEAGTSSDTVVAATLASLPHLTALDLSACDDVASDSGLAQLAAERPSLKCLSLADCWQLSWDGAGCLAPLAPSLTCLNLAGCRRPASSGLSLGALSPLSRLANLSLRSCDGLAAAELAELPLSLTNLDLSFCSSLGTHEGAIGSALRRLPALVSLSLVGTQTGDADLAALGNSPSLCTSLRSLRLGLCCQLGDHGLGVGVARLTGLTSLSLAFCSGATDAGLALLAPLSSLRELDLAGCYKVTAAQLPPLGKLARLDISQTAAGDEALAALADRSEARCLRRLRVQGCIRVSPAGLATLERSAPWLHIEQS